MKLKKNVALSESGFLFDALNGVSYSVNETGLKILNLIRKGEDENAIRKALTDEYDVDPAEAEKDLFDFISQVSSFQMLET